MPGVSRNTSCAWGRFLTPKMRWRVVCGLGVTMASFIPMMALSNVDLPTLGAPMIVTTPACNDAVSIGAIIPKQRDDTTHLEATAPQDIPRAHRTTCGLSGASRGARESEPMALPAAPRPSRRPPALSGNLPVPCPGARAHLSDHSVPAILGPVSAPLQHCRARPSPSRNPRSWPLQGSHGAALGGRYQYTSPSAPDAPQPRSPAAPAPCARPCPDAPS